MTKREELVKEIEELEKLVEKAYETYYGSGCKKGVEKYVLLQSNLITLKLFLKWLFDENS